MDSIIKFSNYYKEVKQFNHSQHIEDRGEIFSFYKENEFFKEWPFNTPKIKFKEDRCSISYRGTVRGLHGDPETWKYITCPIGKLFLFVYDPRLNKKYEFLLDESQKSSILIPPGCINGHQCLSHFCMFLYKQTEYYDTFPADEQWTVRYDDPDLDIRWPIKPMRVSERDKNGVFLKDLKIND